LLGEQLISIKMFGSKVRGDFSQDSDLDILMIVRDKKKVRREKIYDILLEIDLEFDPKISLKIFTKEEFDRNKKLGSPFVFNVEKEGIPI
jgi:predicted nucleotidyltransferase